MSNGSCAFFFLFVINDLGLFFPPLSLPGLFGFPFSLHVFALSSHVVWSYILFCFSSLVASCENILWTLTLIKPHLCLWTPTANDQHGHSVFFKVPNSQNYKFPKMIIFLWSVGKLSRNKNNHLLNLLSQPFRLCELWHWSRQHHATCHLMEICSTWIVGLLCYTTWKNNPKFNMGTFDT